MNSQSDQISSQLYKIIPQLIISGSGIFKYILIKCRVNGQEIGTFIRGNTKFQYHAENYEEFRDQLKKCGFKEVKLKQAKITASRDGVKYQFICPGGGKKCSIYGYSQSYGNVDHREAQQIIVKHLGYSPEQIKLNQKDY